METGFRGTFVISWQQTETDGVAAAPLQDVAAGAVWRWTGAALRVDGPDAVLLLDGDAGMADLHRRAGRVARRMLGLVPGGAAPDATGWDGPGGLGRSFTVTDGRSSHALTLILVPETGAQLLLSRDGLPPRDRDLWVVRLEGPRPRAPEAVPALPGLAPDARISTPSGPRPLWALRPGDRVTTRDSGPQPIVWMGVQRLQPARLQLMPGLRPVRLRVPGAADLLVSPRQRLLVQGAGTEALFNSPEVLVTAADLCDGTAIRPDRQRREVSYVQIMLDRHEILYANGLAIGSYDPAEIAGAAGFAPARRCLSAAEAAILQHDLAA